MKRSGFSANYAYNVLGAPMPIATSLGTVPFYIHQIGAGRYGVVTISWVLLGYFGFLDFGMSRASANALARIGTSSPRDRSRVLMTAFYSNLFMGAVGGLILYGAGALILLHVVKIPGSLVGETRQAYPWMAAMLPLGMLAGVFQGALESRERFLLSNTLSAFGTMAGQLIPLACAVLIGPSLATVIPAILLSRLLLVAVSALVVARQEWPIRLLDLDLIWLRRLFGYGSWVSISALLNPILDTSNQLVIGATLGAAAVAGYSVPMVLAMRPQVVATALARTLFPRVSRMDVVEARQTTRVAAGSLAYGFGTVCAPAILISGTFLHLWVGAHFAVASSPVAQILLFGAWANGVAFMPYGFLQAQGRPRGHGDYRAGRGGPVLPRAVGPDRDNGAGGRGAGLDAARHGQLHRPVRDQRLPRPRDDAAAAGGRVDAGLRRDRTVAADGHRQRRRRLDHGRSAVRVARGAVRPDPAAGRPEPAPAGAREWKARPGIRRAVVRVGHIVRRARSPVSGLLLTAALALPGAARAQLVQQYFPSDIPGYAPDFSASVVQREIQDARAQGVEVDSFVIRPSLTEGFGYNSNTLGVPGSGSTELDSAASVRINSDWTRDAIGAAVTVDNRRYPDRPVAGYTNWSASAGGSLTLGSDIATLAYSHLGLNLAATDLGVFGVINPIPYSVDDARVGYSAMLGRFSVSPSFEFENFSFGVASGANAVSDDSLRHRDEIGTITTRYELSTGDAAVVILRGIGAQFGTATVNSYTDFAGFAGLDFRSDALVQYRLLVGGETRRFQGPDGASISSPTAELDVVWIPRRTDTITTTFARRLDDPESPFARNQTVTDLRLQLDHELRRNVFLRAYGDLGISDSRSSTAGSLSFNQTQVHFGTSATWQVNRDVAGTLGYGYSNSSFGSGVPSTVFVGGSGQTVFTSNVVLLSVTLSE